MMTNGLHCILISNFDEFWATMLLFFELVKVSQQRPRHCYYLVGVTLKR
jgi:hypothetical protein